MSSMNIDLSTVSGKRVLLLSYPPTANGTIQTGTRNGVAYYAANPNSTISNTTFTLSGTQTGRVVFVMNSLSNRQMSNITVQQDSNIATSNNIYFMNANASVTTTVFFDNCTFTANSGVFSSTTSVESPLTISNLTGVFQRTNIFLPSYANAYLDSNVTTWTSDPSVYTSATLEQDVVGYSPPVETLSNASFRVSTVSATKGEMLIKLTTPGVLNQNQIENEYTYILAPDTDDGYFSFTGEVTTDMSFTNNTSTRPIKIANTIFNSQLNLTLYNDKSFYFNNCTFVVPSGKKYALSLEANANASASISFGNDGTDTYTRNNIFFNSDTSDNYFIKMNDNSHDRVSGKVYVGLIYNGTLDFATNASDPIPSIFRSAHYYLGGITDNDIEYGGTYTLKNIPDGEEVYPRFYPLVEPTSSDIYYVAKNYYSFVYVDSTTTRSTVSLTLGESRSNPIYRGVYILNWPSGCTLNLDAYINGYNSNDRCLTITGEGTVNTGNLYLTASDTKTYLNADSTITLTSNVSTTEFKRLANSSVGVTLNAYEEHPSVFEYGLTLYENSGDSNFIINNQAFDDYSIDQPAYGKSLKLTFDSNLAAGSIVNSNFEFPVDFTTTSAGQYFVIYNSQIGRNTYSSSYPANLTPLVTASDPNTMYLDEVSVYVNSNQRIFANVEVTHVSNTTVYLVGSSNGSTFDLTNNNNARYLEYTLGNVSLLDGSYKFINYDSTAALTFLTGNVTIYESTFDRMITINSGNNSLELADNTFEGDYATHGDNYSLTLIGTNVALNGSNFYVRENMRALSFTTEPTITASPTVNYYAGNFDGEFTTASTQNFLEQNYPISLISGANTYAFGTVGFNLTLVQTTSDETIIHNTEFQDGLWLDVGSGNINFQNISATSNTDVGNIIALTGSGNLIFSSPQSTLTLPLITNSNTEGRFIRDRNCSSASIIFSENPLLYVTGSNTEGTSFVRFASTGNVKTDVNNNVANIIVSDGINFTSDGINGFVTVAENNLANLLLMTEENMTLTFLDSTRMPTINTNSNVTIKNSSLTGNVNDRATITVVGNSNNFVYFDTNTLEQAGTKNFIYLNSITSIYGTDANLNIFNMTGTSIDLDLEDKPAVDDNSVKGPFSKINLTGTDGSSYYIDNYSTGLSIGNIVVASNATVSVDSQIKLTFDVNAGKTLYLDNITVDLSTLKTSDSTVDCALRTTGSGTVYISGLVSLDSRFARELWLYETEPIDGGGSILLTIRPFDPTTSGSDGLVDFSNQPIVVYNAGVELVEPSASNVYVINNVTSGNLIIRTSHDTSEPYNVVLTQGSASKVSLNLRDGTTLNLSNSNVNVSNNNYAVVINNGNTSVLNITNCIFEQGGNLDNSGVVYVSGGSGSLNMSNCSLTQYGDSSVLNVEADGTLSLDNCTLVKETLGSSNTRLLNLNGDLTDIQLSNCSLTQTNSVSNSYIIALSGATTSNISISDTTLTETGNAIVLSVDAVSSTLTLSNVQIQENGSSKTLEVSGSSQVSISSSTINGAYRSLSFNDGDVNLTADNMSLTGSGPLIEVVNGGDVVMNLSNIVIIQNSSGNAIIISSDNANVQLVDTQILSQDSALRITTTTDSVVNASNLTLEGGNSPMVLTSSNNNDITIASSTFTCNSNMLQASGANSLNLSVSNTSLTEVSGTLFNLTGGETNITFDTATLTGVDNAVNVQATGNVSLLTTGAILASGAFTVNTTNDANILIDTINQTTSTTDALVISARQLNLDVSDSTVYSVYSGITANSTANSTVAVNGVNLTAGTGQAVSITSSKSTNTTMQGTILNAYTKGIEISVDEEALVELGAVVTTTSTDLGLSVSANIANVTLSDFTVGSGGAGLIFNSPNGLDLSLITAAIVNATSDILSVSAKTSNIVIDNTNLLSGFGGITIVSNVAANIDIDNLTLTSTSEAINLTTGQSNILLSNTSVTTQASGITIAATGDSLCEVNNLVLTSAGDDSLNLSAVKSNLIVSNSSLTGSSGGITIVATDSAETTLNLISVGATSSETLNVSAGTTSNVSLTDVALTGGVGGVQLSATGDNLTDLSNVSIQASGGDSLTVSGNNVAVSITDNSLVSGVDKGVSVSASGSANVIVQNLTLTCSVDEALKVVSTNTSNVSVSDSSLTGGSSGIKVENTADSVLDISNVAVNVTGEESLKISSTSTLLTINDTTLNGGSSGANITTSGDANINMDNTNITALSDESLKVSTGTTSTVAVSNSTLSGGVSGIKVESTADSQINVSNVNVNTVEALSVTSDNAALALDNSALIGTTSGIVVNATSTVNVLIETLTLGGISDKSLSVEGSQTVVSLANSMVANRILIESSLDNQFNMINTSVEENTGANILTIVGDTNTVDLSTVIFSGTSTILSLQGVGSALVKVADTTAISAGGSVLIDIKGATTQLDATNSTVFGAGKAVVVQADNSNITLTNMNIASPESLVTLTGATSATFNITNSTLQESGSDTTLNIDSTTTDFLLSNSTISASGPVVSLNSTTSNISLIDSSVSGGSTLVGLTSGISSQLNIINSNLTENGVGTLIDLTSSTSDLLLQNSNITGQGKIIDLDSQYNTLTLNTVNIDGSSNIINITGGSTTSLSVESCTLTENGSDLVLNAESTTTTVSLSNTIITGQGKIARVSGALPTLTLSNATITAGGNVFTLVDGTVTDLSLTDTTVNSSGLGTLVEVHTGTANINLDNTTLIGLSKGLDLTADFTTLTLETANITANSNIISVAGSTTATLNLANVALAENGTDTIIAVNSTDTFLTLNSTTLTGSGPVISLSSNGATVSGDNLTATGGQSAFTLSGALVADLSLTNSTMTVNGNSNVVDISSSVSALQLNNVSLSGEGKVFIVNSETSNVSLTQTTMRGGSNIVSLTGGSLSNIQVNNCTFTENGTDTVMSFGSTSTDLSLNTCTLSGNGAVLTVDATSSNLTINSTNLYGNSNIVSLSRGSTSVISVADSILHENGTATVLALDSSDLTLTLANGTLSGNGKVLTVAGSNANLTVSSSLLNGNSNILSVSGTNSTLNLADSILTENGTETVLSITGTSSDVNINNVSLSGNASVVSVSTTTANLSVSSCSMLGNSEVLSLVSSSSGILNISSTTMNMTGNGNVVSLRTNTGSATLLDSVLNKTGDLLANSFVVSIVGNSLATANISNVQATQTGGNSDSAVLSIVGANVVALTSSTLRQIGGSGSNLKALSVVGGVGDLNISASTLTQENTSSANSEVIYLSGRSNTVSVSSSSTITNSANATDTSTIFVDKSSSNISIDSSTVLDSISQYSLYLQTYTGQLNTNNATLGGVVPVFWTNLSSFSPNYQPFVSQQNYIALDWLSPISKSYTRRTDGVIFDNSNSSSTGSNNVVNLGLAFGKAMTTSNTNALTLSTSVLSTESFAQTSAYTSDRFTSGLLGGFFLDNTYYGTRTYTDTELAQRYNKLTIPVQQKDDTDNYWVGNVSLQTSIQPAGSFGLFSASLSNVSYQITETRPLPTMTITGDSLTQELGEGNDVSTSVNIIKTYDTVANALVATGSDFGSFSIALSKKSLIPIYAFLTALSGNLQMLTYQTPQSNSYVNYSPSGVYAEISGYSSSPTTSSSIRVKANSAFVTSSLENSLVLTSVGTYFNSATSTYPTLPAGEPILTANSNVSINTTSRNILFPLASTDGQFSAVSNNVYNLQSATRATSYSTNFTMHSTTLAQNTVANKFDLYLRVDNSPSTNPQRLYIFNDTGSNISYSFEQNTTVTQTANLRVLSTVATAGGLTINSFPANVRAQANVALGTAPTSTYVQLPNPSVNNVFVVTVVQTLNNPSLHTMGANIDGSFFIAPFERIQVYDPASDTLVATDPNPTRINTQIRVPFGVMLAASTSSSFDNASYSATDSNVVVSFNNLNSLFSTINSKASITTPSAGSTSTFNLRARTIGRVPLANTTVRLLFARTSADYANSDILQPISFSGGLTSANVSASATTRTSYNVRQISVPIAQGASESDLITATITGDRKVWGSGLYSFWLSNNYSYNVSGTVQNLESFAGTAFRGIAMARITESNTRSMYIQPIQVGDAFRRITLSEANINLAVATRPFDYFARAPDLAAAAVANADAGTYTYSTLNVANASASTFFSNVFIDSSIASTTLRVPISMTLNTIPHHFQTGVSYRSRMQYFYTKSTTATDYVQPIDSGSSAISLYTTSTSSTLFANNTIIIHTDSSDPANTSTRTAFLDFTNANLETVPTIYVWGQQQVVNSSNVVVTDSDYHGTTLDSASNLYRYPLFKISLSSSAASAGDPLTTGIWRIYSDLNNNLVLQSRQNGFNTDPYITRLTVDNSITTNTNLIGSGGSGGSSSSSGGVSGLSSSANTITLNSGNVLNFGSFNYGTNLQYTSRNVSFSADQSKWGSTSALFSSAGNAFITVNNIDLSGFSNPGRFTLEGWFYLTTQSSEQTLFSLTGPNGERYLWLRLNTSLQLGLSTGIGSNVFAVNDSFRSISPVLNQWNHIAVMWGTSGSASDTTIRFMVNSNLFFNASGTLIPTIGFATLHIGALGVSGSYSSCLRDAYVSDVRLSVAPRYTGDNGVDISTNLRPPSAAFVGDANTAFLHHFTGSTSLTTFNSQEAGQETPTPVQAQLSSIDGNATIDNLRLANLIVNSGGNSALTIDAYSNTMTLTGNYSLNFGTFSTTQNVVYTTVGASMTNTEKKVGVASAFLVNTSNSYIQVSNIPTTNFANNIFTVEFWFRFTSSITTPQTLFSMTTSAGTRYIWVRVNSDQYVYADFGNNGSFNGGTSVASTNRVNMGDWNQLVFQYDSTGYQMYLSGARQFNYTQTGINIPSSGFSQFYFGAYRNVNNIEQCMRNAYIDEIRISTVARYSGSSISGFSYSSPTPFVPDANTAFLHRLNGWTKPTDFADVNSGQEVPTINRAQLTTGNVICNNMTATSLTLNSLTSSATGNVLFWNNGVITRGPTPSAGTYTTGTSSTASFGAANRVTGPGTIHNVNASQLFFFYNSANTQIGSGFQVNQNDTFFVPPGIRCAANGSNFTYFAWS